MLTAKLAELAPHFLQENNYKILKQTVCKEPCLLLLIIYSREVKISAIHILIFSFSIFQLVSTCSTSASSSTCTETWPSTQQPCPSLWWKSPGKTSVLTLSLSFNVKSNLRIDGFYGRPPWRAFTTFHFGKTEYLCLHFIDSSASPLWSCCHLLNSRLRQ